ncbi:MAG: hypothetical protein HQK77_01215 [Desulfobacterales bacterium]|nr:hypothetical protein [Desulfobacterales bacterium]
MKKRFILHLFIFVNLVLCFVNTAYLQTEKIFIYAYSPEIYTEKFSKLKIDFDSYLSQFGSYEFQPFSNREIFENYIKDKHQCAILLSSWHYKKIAKAYSLVPILVGVKNGSIYQKSVLVSRKQKIEITDIFTNRIASANSIEYTKSLLMAMYNLPDPDKINRIIIVPKEIDALFSVGFGFSEIAVTSRNSLDRFKAYEPILYQKLAIGAESKNILLPIIAVPDGFQKDSQTTINIIKNMTKTQAIDTIHLLGIDAWQPIDLSELEN